jgi:TorA maturation chaperone TorD
MDYTQLAQQRSNVYGFLSQVYLHEPTIDFIRLLMSRNMKDLLEEAGFNAGEQLKEGNEEDFHEELQVEYTRLFLGPGQHVCPYESVWRDGSSMLWGKTTGKIKNFIESLGLTYRTEWSGLPDHIGVELECMQKLTLKEKEGRERKKDKEVLTCLEIEDKLLNEHLLAWVPLFCNEVGKESQVLFYRSIATLTKQYLEYEKELLHNLCATSDRESLIAE